VPASPGLAGTGASAKPINTILELSDANLARILDFARDFALWVILVYENQRFIRYPRIYGSGSQQELMDQLGEIYCTVYPTRSSCRMRI
jgi:hypothetical protein